MNRATEHNAETGIRFVSLLQTRHSSRPYRHAKRAKPLLADPALSVTEIGVDLGFPKTGSFMAAFRKLVARTPTDYRRSLAVTGA